jgi:adenylosuccinate lyase
MKLKSVDKSRIIMILNYINKLDNDLDLFALIPEEVLYLILKRLDYNSLNIICNMSSNFNRICSDNVMKPLIEEKKQYVRTRKDINYYKEIHKIIDVNKMQSSNKGYTVIELRKYAKMLDLPLSGNKADLVDRIMYDRSELGL